MSIMIFWVVTPFGLVGDEGEVDRFLPDIGNHLQNHTASQPTTVRLSKLSKYESDEDALS
jgi:hypothetical protein